MNLDKFTINAKETGLSGNNITVTDNGSGFVSATRLNLVDNKLTGGKDASFTLDGKTSTSKSNTFTIDGVTYTLKGKTGASTTITLEQDTDGIYNLIKGFVDKYNEIISTINNEYNEKRNRDYPPLTDAQKEEMTENDIKLWEEKAKAGMLYRDSILGNITNDMRRAMYDSIYTTSGDSNTKLSYNLASIGITTGSYQDMGKLIIDENKLKEAIKNSPEQVIQLFTQESDVAYSPDLTAVQRKERYEENGIIYRLYDIIENNFVLKLSLKESDKKRLITALNYFKIHSFSNNTYLIMLNETNEKIPNSLINLLTPDQHIVFWEMFDNQKPIWIRQQFRKEGFYIEDNAINFIIDTVENNKAQFENVIQNICTFLKLNPSKGNLIDKNLIEYFLYHSKEESAFTLYQALLEGNLEKSLGILEKIFYTEDELVLLNGLLWSHRRFLAALDMNENQNMAEEAIFKELNIKIKRVKDEISKGLKRYNFSDMCFMTYYILELDYYLKTLPEDLKLVKLQEFLVRFIYGSNRKSFLQGELLYLLS